MWRAMLLVIFFACLVNSASVDQPEKRTATDSYTDALQKNRNEDSVASRGSFEHPYPDNSISPGYSYGPPPSTEYGQPPSIEYGPPSHTPSNTYGPVQETYGPPGYFPHHRPINVYNYGPSPHKFSIVHSAPRDEHWLFDKFKFKLDMFTIGKILIKLIIFKKIVKFIALICLLLFLPKLQSKHMNVIDMLSGGEEGGEEETDEKRSFDVYESQQRRVNEVSKFAMTAIQSFTDKHLNKCGNLTDIPYRFQSMVDIIDDRYPYEKIIEMFLPINQYNVFASPQKHMKKIHKKGRKPQTAQRSIETEEDQLHIETATTASTDDLIASSSVSSTLNHSFENKSDANESGVNVLSGRDLIFE